MRPVTFAIAFSLFSAANAHDCTQPVLPAGRLPKSKVELFNTQYKAYGECIKQFIATQNGVVGDKEKAIAQLRAEANAAIDAGNAASAEYNRFASHIAEIAAQ
jgi:hypothetical protein